MPKEECANCVYYLDDNRGEIRSGYGTCRRYPEHVKTNDGRWCGEHQPAPVE